MKQAYKFLVGLGIFGYLVLFAVVIALAIGWILNVYHLIVIAMKGGVEITIPLILQIVGVFAAPLGGVLGWVL